MRPTSSLLRSEAGTAECGVATNGVGRPRLEVGAVHRTQLHIVASPAEVRRSLEVGAPGLVEDEIARRWVSVGVDEVALGILLLPLEEASVVVNEDRKGRRKRRQHRRLLKRDEARVLVEQLG